MQRRKRILITFFRGDIPVLIALTCVVLISFSSLMYRASSQPPKPKQTHSRPVLSRFFKDSFCHSHENITVQLHSRHNERRTCYGNFNRARSSRATYRHALEAPPLSALCISNPFHGFYDCIWPLVHYISICMTKGDRQKRYIVVDDNKIPEKRRNAWAVQAQRIFIQKVHPTARTLCSGDIPNGTEICFNRVVRFKKNTLFRPLRYNMRVTGRYTFSVPHPEPLKRRGLNLFRDTILTHYGRSANAIVPDLGNARVLVYDRSNDSRRRKWQNGHEFVKLLRAEIGSRAEIVHVRGISRVFEEQVALFNDATVMVAPHGAAMANSLFMRKNSAIVEIASRDCMQKNETRSVVFDEYAMKADPNTWTVWHAGYLDILLAHAPCTLTEQGDGDFVTNNPSLLKLTRTLIDAQTVVGSSIGP